MKINVENVHQGSYEYNEKCYKECSKGSYLDFDEFKCNECKLWCKNVIHMKFVLIMMMIIIYLKKKNVIKNAQIDLEKIQLPKCVNHVEENVNIVMKIKIFTKYVMKDFH